jgi:hypothetical protein
MADIDDLTPALILSAACFWDPDLRTIPTLVARMSQMAQCKSPILFILVFATGWSFFGNALHVLLFLANPRGTPFICNRLRSSDSQRALLG